MRTLTRYVLLELTKVFLASLLAFTAMIVIVGVVREAVSQSLPPAQVVWLIPFILPDALRITVPVTLLLATTTVYARMSGENEVVALKALGISPMEILWPAIVMGTLLSLVTYQLNDLAVSWGRNGAQRVVIEAVEEIAYSMLRTQRRYSCPTFAINVKRVEDRRLIRPTLSLKARGSTPAITITAEEAELRSDRAENVLKITLHNGTIDVEGQITVRFPDVYEQEIPLRDASRAKQGSGNPSWLPMREIPEEIVRQRAEIRGYEQELAARAAYEMLGGDFDALTSPEWDTRRRELSEKWSRLYRLQTEPHRRWSAGFSCLFFVWVGAPLALWLRNQGPLTSFFLCFLPILIVYYPFLVWGVDAAKNGTVPPATVWLGNVILFCCGAYLLRKVIRY